MSKEQVVGFAQGSSGSPSDFIRDSLREAMTDAWNDICSDTDCHPLDIDRQGKRLFFKPGHWADAIAMHLTSALANHSAFADLMASGGLNDTPTDDQQIVDQINYLRGGEGDSVTILCDNPDFNGQPNCAVECNGDWTRWEDRRYTGDTLLDALNAAWLECQQWRTALDYGREKWPPAAPRTPAEGEPPNARNRIEARDKLIETLEAENTRLVSLVENAAKDVRLATIEECRDAAFAAYGKIATGDYVLTGPAGIARSMLNAIDGLRLSDTSTVGAPK